MERPSNEILRVSPAKRIPFFVRRYRSLSFSTMSSAVELMKHRRVHTAAVPTFMQSSSLDDELQAVAIRVPSLSPQPGVVCYHTPLNYWLSCAGVPRCTPSYRFIQKEHGLGILA